MSILLQITIMAVLCGLAAVLVALLMQIRRTARGMEVFLESSQRSLVAIADDVHAACHRMNAVADSLQGSLDELAIYARSLGDLRRSVRDFHARIQSALECATHSCGGLMKAISATQGVFRKKEPTMNEQEKFS